MIKNLGENSSILNQFIAELRDISVQNDSMRFRKNLERTGEIIAYEISKKLNFSEKEIQTPLGSAKAQILDEKIVLAAILRAALPLHQGMLNIFDKAENAFISAYRKYDKENDFEIKVEYISSPSIEEKILIIADPMLATGASMALAIDALKQLGKPKHIHIVSVIASKEGVQYIKKKFNEEDYTLWLGAIDDELTAKAYIVPGLGDAGDLAYGKKED